MANDTKRGIKIFLDTAGYSTGIDEIVKKTNEYREKLKELEEAGKGNTRQAERLRNQIQKSTQTEEEYKARLAETERVLNNLSGASYNQLLSAQKLVQAELKKSIPGTQQHTTALEQNRRVTEALTRAQAAMRVEVGSQGSVFSRSADFVNKYMGIIGGTIASVTGITMTMRKSVNEFAQISEAMAGVKKYTGMADEEIKALNEDFKKMDTRTPRERLNELAQDAGRLGIKGRNDILEFVDAANMINIALGEDLGKDAVKDIGKLAQMFGDDKILGLRGAMLATASAINEVAQNSSASEPYLVSFTAKVAGTAKQAGISQTALIGYASALDQDMQTLEMSSTALQQVMMKIYQTPAKFAKIAGKDVKEFTNLIKTDANEAILQLLEGIRNMGGLAETAPIFKDMQLDGVRAAGVLNTLAGSVDKVRAEQERANDAYRDGTSAIKEYDVQNNTVLANLEKARNDFKEIIIEMGETLAPSMTKLTISSGDLVRILADVIKTLSENERTVKTVIAAIVAYTAGTKASMLMTKMAVGETVRQTVTLNLSKIALVATRSSALALAAAKYLLSGRIDMARKAMLLFNAATKANLIGLAVSAVAALGYGLYQLSTRTKKTTQEVTEATRRTALWGQVTEQTNKQLAEHRAKIALLVSTIHSENISNEKRIEAIEALKKIVPEYTAELSKEGKVINENKKAIDEYVKSLENQIKLEAIKTKAQELFEKKIDIESKNHDTQKKLSELEEKNKYSTEKNPIYERQKALLEGIVQFNKEQIEIIDSDLGFLTSKAAETQLLPQVRTLEIVDAELKATKARLDELKKMTAEEKGKIDGYDKLVSDAKAKIKQLEEERKKFTDTGGGESKEEKERKKKFQAEKADYARHQADIKARYLSGKDDELQTEKQYNKKMEQLQLDHLQRSIDIVGEKSSEAADLQNQINDIKIKQKKEAIQEELDAEKLQYERQQEELKEAYLSGKNEELQTEASYNQAMERLHLQHLERVLQIAGLNADERRKIEKQLLDFKVKCMQDEEKERVKREDKKQKDAEKAVEKQQQQLDRQKQQFEQYGEHIGETIGNLISGQENALRGFASAITDVFFDVLEKVVMAEIAELAAVGIASAAKATAKEIGSKGWIGIASGAALSGLIAAGIATAKSALKGFINKKDDGSSSDDSNSPKTATVKVSQWETGRYDVIGKDDGKTYRNIPFLGPAQTGIVHRTSLVSENGAELIVNAEDLQRLQRHVNYPLVLQAINDARNNQVPQRASGNYSTLNDIPKPSPDNDGVVNMNEFLNELRTLLKHLRNIKAYVLLRDIDKAREIDNKSNDPFTRKKS